jgi:3-methyl-2-oxobutanoate hydroxymethyltransferase
MVEKVTVPSLIQKFHADESLIMLTAYDYTIARILDEANVDCILVGDSLGMVVQGQQNTLAVTLDEMIYHAKLVRRAARRALLVADMPFMTYQVSALQALENAGRLVKEAGVEAVKIEGGSEYAETVSKIVAAGIPVMGHLGLMPSKVNLMGGFKVQGKTAEQAEQILADAKLLEQAGVFSLVLEGIPAELAKAVSDSISIPTIGIGAGIDCAGQVLVTYDLIGLSAEQGYVSPKFVKRYAELNTIIRHAVEAFTEDVKGKRFPAKENTYAATVETKPKPKVGLRAVPDIKLC